MTAVHSKSRIIKNKLEKLRGPQRDEAEFDLYSLRSPEYFKAQQQRELRLKQLDTQSEIRRHPPERHWQSEHMFEIHRFPE